MTLLPKLLKLCEKAISLHLNDIISSSIKQGVRPQIRKRELFTPVPKVYNQKRLFSNVPQKHKLPDVLQQIP